MNIRSLAGRPGNAESSLQALQEQCLGDMFHVSMDRLSYRPLTVPLPLRTLGWILHAGILHANTWMPHLNSLVHEGFIMQRRGQDSTEKKFRTWA